MYFTGPRQGDAFALRQSGDGGGGGLQDKRTFDTILQGLGLGISTQGALIVETLGKHGGREGSREDFISALLLHLLVGLRMSYLERVYLNPKSM